MTRSAKRRSNRYARAIDAAISPDTGGATVAFDAAEARNSAREYGFEDHVLREANFAYCAELLNSRMPKRFPGKARSFEPYPSPQMRYLAEYRPPNPDPGRPRREPPVTDRYLDSVGSW